MYDPPDFPYKELRETFRDEINADELLFNNEIDFNCSLNNEDRELVKVTETIISSVENKLSINENISGNFFNIVENTPIQISNEINSYIEQSPELYVVQSDNMFSYEPTLLDDNTVNQFLLPTVSSDKNKNLESNEPDLLALHTCVMCNEIFTTDADLLDHTIFTHATDPSAVQEPVTTSSTIEKTFIDGANSSVNFECDWLVCSICKRVLSTALESEPKELLCCTGRSGSSGVVSRKLSTMFVCDYCSYLFADGESLDHHKLSCFSDDDLYYPEQEVRSVEGTNNVEVSFTCKICGKQFASDEDLRNHSASCRPPRHRRPYNTSSSNKMWNCGSCNQLFVTARELYRHKRGEDRPAGAPLVAYVCEECDKVLGSVCALHTHKKMHKVTKPGYPCRVCGRRFNQSGHLAIHMRMHTGERPYPCDLCSKAFKVKVERDDHRRTHTGERPFACTSCPKTFTAAARLREHARIHTDQRPYKCDICGAAFRRPYARTVHTLIHTGEKPHECDVCGTAFRYGGVLYCPYYRCIYIIIPHYGIRDHSCTTQHDWFKYRIFKRDGMTKKLR